VSHEVDTKQQASADSTVDQLGTAEKPNALSQHTGGRNLPVPRPISRPAPGRRRWLRIAVVLVFVLLGAAGGAYWWKQHQTQLLPSIVWSNGRIEADEIDIDTKYAGRIAEIFAEEGDMVKSGQVVARMDTRDLEASLKKSEAQVRQAQKSVDEAKANVAQQTSIRLLAKQEMDRAVYLVQKGWQTKEVLDQRQQALDGAQAALNAAEARETETEHALAAATHDVE
jgi:HlyD family secretion protein